MTNVYLAGPITGLTATQAKAYRDELQSGLEYLGYTVFSPMRAKEDPVDMGVLPHSGYEAFTDSPATAT